MRLFNLSRTVWLPERLETVFPFFSDARNLERLTPPWLHFEVLSASDPAMRVGTRIDYRLRIRGLPLRWQSEITVWDPPHCFVDEQRRGPYRLWIHEHRFVEQAGGTLAEDKVQYAVYGGTLTNRFFVLPDLNRIFDYRVEELRKIFGAGGAEAAHSQVSGVSTRN